MRPRPTILRASFRMATEQDQHLPAYDNTALTAYNECPTRGVLRYGMHKRPAHHGRSTALEAGHAMHEVFAWVRLCTLLHHAGDITRVNHHGNRLYGTDRFQEILSVAKAETGDINGVAVRGAIAVLDTGAYYDEPRDRKRTLANMEESAIGYIQKWRWEWPVWVRDAADPRSDVGIEVPFDMVVTLTFTDSDAWDEYVRTRSIYSGVISIQEESIIKDALQKHPHQIERRLTGKIDGIRVIRNKITLEENKTASRLNEAWSLSMRLRSQITGYCIAASVFTEQPVRDADVHGLCIPLPKSYDYGGIITEHVTREDHHINAWIKWFLDTAQGYELDKDNPFDALRYTHSCNAYFSPCSFIAFCDSARDEQEAMLQEYETNVWSPLTEVQD